MADNKGPKGVYLDDSDRDDPIRDWMMTLSIKDLEKLEKLCDKHLGPVQPEGGQKDEQAETEGSNDSSRETRVS